MIKDFIDNTTSEINDAIREYKGLDVPEETAELRLLEMNSVIFEEEPERKYCLKDFLRMFYSDYERVDPFGLEAPTNYMWEVRVFPEAENYKPEEAYPLIFKEPLFNNKEYKLKIGNLRRFLADYQKQTNSWISTNDIMDAEITDLKLVNGGRNYGYMKIRIRING